MSAEEVEKRIGDLVGVSDYKIERMKMILMAEHNDILREQNKLLKLQLQEMRDITSRLNRIVY